MSCDTLQSRDTALKVRPPRSRLTFLASQICLLTDNSWLLHSLSAQLSHQTDTNIHSREETLFLLASINSELSSMISHWITAFPVAWHLVNRLLNSYVTNSMGTFEKEEEWI